MMHLFKNGFFLTIFIILYCFLIKQSQAKHILLLLLCCCFMSPAVYGTLIFHFIFIIISSFIQNSDEIDLIPSFMFDITSLTSMHHHLKMVKCHAGD